MELILEICTLAGLPLVNKQWGLSHAEQTTPFNVAFAAKTFVVLTSQANSRYSPATIGVAQTDVSVSGFYGYAANVTTDRYMDAFW